MTTTRRQIPTGHSAEESPEHQPDGDPLHIDETIMVSSVTDDGTMGCAFFSTQENRILIAQDVALADESMMQRFVSHIQPSVILIPPKFPNSMGEVLDSYADVSYQGEYCETLQKHAPANR